MSAANGVATPDVLPLTDAAQAWLEAHHNPAWKYKAPRIPKLGKPRGAGKDKEFANLVREYKYAVTEGTDLRTIREPVSLDEFIARKASPTYKPWTLPRQRVTLTKLSSAARQAESARIARYVNSRKAA